MRTKILVCLISLLSIYNLLTAQNQPTSQTNSNLDFDTYLTGVQYAVIEPSYSVILKYLLVNAVDGKNMDSNSNEAEQAKLGISDHLKDMGFKIVDESSTYRINSVCDIVQIEYDFDINKKNGVNFFDNISCKFITCNKDEFVFEFTNTINFDNIRWNFSQSFRKYFGNKPSYLPSNQLKLKSNPTSWSEIKLKDHWNNKGFDKIEGIYEKTTSSINSPILKVGVVKSNMGYDIIYLSGASYKDDWDEGELKAKLTSTTTLNFYEAKWYVADKTINEDCSVQFNQGMMYVDIFNKETPYVKLYPTDTNK